MNLLKREMAVEKSQKRKQNVVRAKIKANHGAEKEEQLEVQETFASYREQEKEQREVYLVVDGLG